MKFLAGKIFKMIMFLGLIKQWMPTLKYLLHASKPKPNQSL